jgi:glutathione S-transferase
MLTLVGANLNYSSWTIRAWLGLKYAGVPFRFHDVGLKTTTNWKDKILTFSGAGKVPVLVDGSLSIHESLAICEYVAELAPEANLWPSDLRLRARGRAISCEMLSGFGALRSSMPCNLRGRKGNTHAAQIQDEAVTSDVKRVSEIWHASLEAKSPGGPFLLGAFSIADCMYFPVACRFRTYGVNLPPLLADYATALFATPVAQELEALAQEAQAIEEYDRALSA